MNYSAVKKLSIIAFLAATGYFTGLAGLDEIDGAHGAGQAAIQDKAPESETPPAPDFTLPDIANGKSVTLSAYKGKWVFVNFWATWCSPCVYEMPMMNTLYNNMRKDGLEMLAISVDEGSPILVKQFADRFKFDFKILHDPDNSVMRRYGIRSIPRTYVVDPDGNIQAAADGLRSWDDPEMVKFFRGLMRDFDKKKEAEKHKVKKEATG